MSIGVENLNWVPLVGEFEPKGTTLIFKGREFETLKDGGQPAKSAAVGQCICNRTFSEGRIAAEIEFSEDDPRPLAQIVFSYNPNTTNRDMITAGLGNASSMFSIRSWNNAQWTVLAQGGDRINLKPKRKYRVQVSVSGSAVSLILDGVQVLSTVLPSQPIESQVGVFCIGTKDITISNFTVETEIPKVFVVMQYAPQYDELYNEVIRPVCEEMGLAPVRADETHSPGIIIADIINQIVASKVIIAEITPVNPNVYYELGYSHALNKPTILVADKEIAKLPFDVSPFRTLFYENSIGGKKRVEEGLRKYLRSMLPQRGG